MASVREVVVELLRAKGMTTVFGNPGSTELPMLADFPSDFRYVLALHEAVAVGMADGFAQASGTVAHVNLHTAPGVGNAVGALFNAKANKAPLLVTAGQQSRRLMGVEANLTNRDAVQGPQPYVKWANEPARAADVPRAIARAIEHAALPPRGPAFVSIPMDDWKQHGEPVAARAVDGRAAPSAAAISALVERLRRARRPALVAGPDIDASGGWELAVALAERLRAAVWATPAPGGGRLGFPEDHALFQGILPPAIGPAGETLAAHDLVLVVGSSVFPYYPDLDGPFLHPDTELVHITSDPDEAARAPVGDAIVADPALALAALLAALPETAPQREPPPARPGPAEPDPPAEPGASPSPSLVHGALAAAFPAGGIVVLESPSSTLALRNQLRLDRPGSYYFAAGGGLGFGLPAALGVQLAHPERPVICVVGEGSAQYAITALWTAAAYAIPVTFLVLRNAEYAILKWFGALEGVGGAPGLDLPGLDVVPVARGYGVPATQLSGADALAEHLRAEATGPRLLQVDVAPGMALA